MHASRDWPPSLSEENNMRFLTYMASVFTTLYLFSGLVKDSHDVQRACVRAYEPAATQTQTMTMNYANSGVFFLAQPTQTRRKCGVLRTTTAHRAWCTVIATSHVDEINTQYVQSACSIGTVSFDRKNKLN